MSREFGMTLMIFFANVVFPEPLGPAIATYYIECKYMNIMNHNNACTRTNIVRCFC
jgi:hypothetical protein